MHVTLYCFVTAQQNKTRRNLNLIYIHIVDLESLMLHAKFQGPRPLGSGEEDF